MGVGAVEDLVKQEQQRHRALRDPDKVPEPDELRIEAMAALVIADHALRQQAGGGK
jgi:hypothetical protein